VNGVSFALPLLPEAANMDQGHNSYLKRLSLLLFCGILLLTGAGMAEAAKELKGVSLRPLWAISGYFVAHNSTWGEREAKGLLFQPLDISRDAISFDGRVCKGVQFRQEKVQAADYLRNVWQVTPQEVGIEDRELQVVKTNCTITGFQEYLRLSDNRLVVPINGVFFHFEPVLTR
jgi:hypothetical protein